MKRDGFLAHLSASEILYKIYFFPAESTKPKVPDICIHYESDQYDPYFWDACRTDRKFYKLSATINSIILYFIFKLFLV